MHIFSALPHLLGKRTECRDLLEKRATLKMPGLQIRLRNQSLEFQTSKSSYFGESSLKRSYDGVADVRQNSDNSESSEFHTEFHKHEDRHHCTHVADVSIVRVSS